MYGPNSEQIVRRFTHNTRSLYREQQPTWQLRATAPKTQKHVHGSHCSHKKTSTQTKLVVGLAALGVAVLSYTVLPALTVTLAVLALNALIEYHKVFTKGVPLDLEILFLGSAIVSSTYGIGWGLAIALAGPFLASAVQGHLCSSAWVKVVGVAACALVAVVLPTNTISTIVAIATGVLVVYGQLVLSGKASFMTILNRASCFGFNAWLAIFFMAGIRSISTL